MVIGYIRISTTDQNTARQEALSVTFACSALSYCYSVLSNDSFSDTLKDTVRAIYLYNQAANAYALSRE